MVPKGYKFSEQAKRNMGLSHVGSKRTEATKQKMRVMQGFNKALNPLWRCEDCGHRKIKYGQGKCKKCYSKYAVGEKASQWKGGITPLIKQVRGCFNYRQWRSDIYTRDNFTCVLCRQRGGEINADHYPVTFAAIFKRNKIGSLEQATKCEEFWNLNNGRTLCVPCHRKTFTFKKR